MPTHLPVILVSILVTTMAQEDDAVKKEMKRLQGTWKVTSMVMAGKPLPVDKQPHELVIEGDKLSLKEGDKQATVMSIKIDPTQKPKAMDLLITRGAERVSWKCIYALEGDILKIAMPLTIKKGDKTPLPRDPNTRPESFDSDRWPLGVITAKRAAP
jgi:uncharacterized protein (TIGR03067 family)